MSSAAAPARATPAGVAAAGRALLAGVVVGAAFSIILVASRSLLGGRALPFWLENSAGVWFVAAFVAGLLTRRAVLGGVAGALALVMGLVIHDSVSFVTGEEFRVQVIPMVRPMWLLTSTAVGAIVGMLGGWSASRPRRGWIGVALVGGVVVGEPAALFAGDSPHAAFDERVGAAQAILGVAAVAGAVRGPPRWWALLVVAGVAAGVLAVELATGLITRLVWG